MLKSTVNEKSAPKVVRELVCLISKPGVVVLRCGPGNPDSLFFSGVVVSNEGSESKYHEIGYFSDKWNIGSFVRFHGSVVLENS